MLDSGDKDWNMVIAPPVASGKLTKLKATTKFHWLKKKNFPKSDNALFE